MVRSEIREGAYNETRTNEKPKEEISNLKTFPHGEFEDLLTVICGESMKTATPPDLPTGGETKEECAPIAAERERTQQILVSTTERISGL